MNPETTKSLFGETNWQELDEWPGWQYVFFDLTSDKQVIFYRIEQFESEEDLAFTDQLVPRVPFTWLLKTGEEDLFNAFLDQYRSRYSTPLFVLANEENKSAEGQQLPDQENIIRFNPGEEGVMRELLLKSLKLAMIENQERDFA